MDEGLDCDCVRLGSGVCVSVSHLYEVQGCLGSAYGLHSYSCNVDFRLVLYTYTAGMYGVCLRHSSNVTPILLVIFFALLHTKCLGGWIRLTWRTSRLSRPGILQTGLLYRYCLLTSFFRRQELAVGLKSEEHHELMETQCRSRTEVVEAQRPIRITPRSSSGILADFIEREKAGLSFRGLRSAEYKGRTSLLTRRRLRTAIGG